MARDVMTFFERPISLTCMLIAFLLMSYPLIQKVMRKRRAAKAT